MTTSEIILRWIMENREYCNNYDVGVKSPSIVP